MRLFKYYSTSKWTADSLKNVQFYFSNFSELNDPCEIIVSGCTQTQLQQLRFNFNDPKDPNGIFCLCERNDNLHMWTQYSDGHKGIVVEFETSEDIDFFKELGKVVYSKTPPIYKDTMKVKDVVLTKSVDSDKELEWRVFEKNGLKPINPNAIKSITFGYKFPLGCSVTTDPPDDLHLLHKDNKEKIQASVDIDNIYWKNTLPKHIEFYQMTIEHGTYNLIQSPKFQKSDLH
jgi:hypothetical protein